MAVVAASMRNIVTWRSTTLIFKPGFKPCGHRNMQLMVLNNTTWSRVTPMWEYCSRNTSMMNRTRNRHFINRLFRHLYIQPHSACESKDSPPEDVSTRQRLVIFDKDGTLVCVHALWAPWIRGFVQRLEDATSAKLAKTLFDKLSFDNTTGKLKQGVLGEGTVSQVKDTIVKILIDEGIPRDRVTNIMEANWHSRDLSNYGGVEPIGDLNLLFKELKSRKYLIAVNTSASRKETERTIDALNLNHLIDMLVCGDDDGVEPKPHPSTAIEICNKLKVQPRDAIMIGDSVNDLILANNAGLKCGIGVLTGITPQDVLERHTKYVVNDVHQALNLIQETLSD